MKLGFWLSKMSNFFQRSFNKYRNQKTNGYDSKAENKRAEELKLLQQAGQIHSLEFQKSIELQPKFISNKGIKERNIVYVADFYYFDEGRQKWIIEDTKGFKTKDFMLKRKMLEYGLKDKQDTEFLMS